MRNWRWGFVLLLYLAFFMGTEALKFHRTEHTERISGSAGDVLEDDPVGRLKVFVYELPSKYNKKIIQKDSRCLNHMFAAEIYMHRFLLSSPVRTLNPEEADWFYTPVYTTCDLTPNGLPLPFKSPRMMRSAIQLISSLSHTILLLGRYKSSPHPLSHTHKVLLDSITLCNCRNKKRLVGEFFHCFIVQLWFKPLDKEGRFNYNSSLCSSPENEIPFHPSKYSSIHLCIFLWLVL